MELVERVRAALPQARETSMFGRVGFLVEGALVCSAGEAGLLVRVARADQAALVAQGGVGPMTMGGRTSRTWVEVGPGALTTDEALTEWLDRGVAAARAARWATPGR